MLERLKIEFKANALAATLSGGQKRKLSLSIALIGGSEVKNKFKWITTKGKNRKNINKVNAR